MCGREFYFRDTYNGFEKNEFSCVKYLWDRGKDGSDILLHNYNSK